MSTPVDVATPFAVKVDEDELQPRLEFPGEVLAGNPVMHSRLFWESTDKQQARGVFEALPGQFSWNFGWGEFFVVASGHATVETADGQSIELLPGTAGMFKPGDRTVWTVHQTLRKAFHKDLAAEA